ncbi:hypothetical protein BO86DRAFT_394606 [Aspergillus japonicus CBS 114.51]|uniref:Uncharacterized protein n=1 Tax=Aspergillus japonicus CBS 114.51 TaxID=1448312 RepID=A0A8T8XFI3_ASPJA|nr:hypothetical protein BO86DRAFT_394606 [Aspergillus japonicus CBS 114.51]RAH86811.1 hypothetical protein BO86DRAFT_394606 [Aspergillus japonicus CBS 114.51]
MEVPLLDEPTAAWAPVDTPGPPPSATSAIYKIIMHCGGQDSSRLCLVGKNIHFMKARLLDGLVPLSEAQWQEQDSTTPPTWSAPASISAPLRPWARADGLAEFPAILDLRALWAEYVPAVYEVMTRTAHAWVLAHLTRLKQRMLDEDLFDTGAVGQTDIEARVAKFYVRWRLLADITFQADAGFWMPLNGYKGYRVPTEIVAGLHHPQINEFAEVYPRRHSEVLTAQVQAVPELQTSSTGENSEENKISSALLRLRRFMSAVTVAEDQVRLELRGSLSPPLTELPPAPWIERALRVCTEAMSGLPEDAEAQTIGFAVYRAAYHNISDEEWEVVKAKVEEQVAAWGVGEPGAEEEKPLLKLRWFDCRELGIDPKDTEAVRRLVPRPLFHFRILRTQHPLLNQLSFLMLDPWSASSYIRTDQDRLPRDFRPHLLAVDAEFAPSLIPEAVSPGYTGQMRILGNLVWSELYAMSMMQSAQLWDLWPLAAEHPQKVYTGAVVPSQIQEWREQNRLPRWGFGWTDAPAIRTQ